MIVLFLAERLGKWPDSVMSRYTQPQIFEMYEHMVEMDMRRMGGSQAKADPSKLGQVLPDAEADRLFADLLSGAVKEKKDGGQTGQPSP